MGMGPNPTFEKASKAGAAIAAFRILKFGADDDHLIQSAAATDGHMGVAAHAAAAAEDSIRAVLAGIAKVEYGGTITRGDRITADANGKAVKAADLTIASGATPVTSSAANGAIIAGSVPPSRTVGIAMKSGVLNDIGVVLLYPS
ncbi:MAG: DUF2190 domain-containing protein [Rhodospirillales bacterium]